MDSLKQDDINELKLRFKTSCKDSKAKILLQGFVCDLSRFTSEAFTALRQDSNSPLPTTPTENLLTPMPMHDGYFPFMEEDDPVENRENVPPIENQQEVPPEGDGIRDDMLPSTSTETEIVHLSANLENAALTEAIEYLAIFDDDA